MGAESAIGTPIASAADVRIVLPCYVNLHPDFAHSIVKVFPTQYDVFVNGGLGPQELQQMLQEIKLYGKQ